MPCSHAMLRTAVRCSRGPREHTNNVLPPVVQELTIQREVQLATEHTALPCADRMKARPGGVRFLVRTDCLG